MTISCDEHCASASYRRKHACKCVAVCSLANESLTSVRRRFVSLNCCAVASAQRSTWTKTRQLAEKHREETTTTIDDKKLGYRRGTARCVVSVEILPIATQQCRNYLYDKSWTNRSYEVGGLRCNKHLHSTVTRSSRFHCLIGVINKPTTVELRISPVYRRLAVAKFSKSTM